MILKKGMNFVSVRGHFVVGPRFRGTSSVRKFGLKLSTMGGGNGFNFVGGGKRFIVRPRFSCTSGFESGVLTAVGRSNGFKTVGLEKRVIIPYGCVLRRTVVDIPVSGGMCHRGRRRIGGTGKGNSFSSLLSGVTRYDERIGRGVGGPKTRIVASSLEVERSGNGVNLMIKKRAMVPARCRRLVVTRSKFILTYGRSG